MEKESQNVGPDEENVSEPVDFILDDAPRSKGQGTDTFRHAAERVRARKRLENAEQVLGNNESGVDSLEIGDGFLTKV